MLTSFFDPRVNLQNQVGVFLASGQVTQGPQLAEGFPAAGFPAGVLHYLRVKDPGGLPRTLGIVVEDAGLAQHHGGKGLQGGAGKPLPIPVHPRCRRG